MTLKLRAKVNFPASVTGAAGIAVTKANGIWTIAPDFGSLTELTDISSPADSQVWLYTPSTGIYNTVTIETLTEAINSLPVSADLDMDSHKITNLSDGTDDGDAINKRQADAAYQPLDGALTSIAGLTTAADKMIYTTASDTYDVTTVTTFARSILDDPDAATVRTTLGLGDAAVADSADFATAAQGATADSALQPGDIGSTVQGYDAALADIAGITFTQGDLLYFDGTNVVNLGPGTDGQFLKTQGAGANPVWTTITGGGDVLSTNNGSDFANKAATLVNLGMPSDPGADRILFWDDSAGAWTPLTITDNLVINGTQLRAIETHGIALSDEVTAIATGTNKATFSLPYAFTVTGVYAMLNTASSSGTPTIDINEAGTTILSTKLTIDANEKTSATAATAAVISDASIAANAEIGFDIDTAGTGAKGLKVFIQGYRT